MRPDRKMPHCAPTMPRQWGSPLVRALHWIITGISFTVVIEPRFSLTGAAVRLQTMFGPAVHRAIFASMRRLHVGGVPIDLLTLKDELAKHTVVAVPDSLSGNK